MGHVAEHGGLGQQWLRIHGQACVYTHWLEHISTDDINRIRKPRQTTTWRLLVVCAWAQAGKTHQPHMTEVLGSQLYVYTSYHLATVLCIYTVHVYTYIHGPKAQNSCPGFAPSFFWYCTLDFSCILYLLQPRDVHCMYIHVDSQLQVLYMY